MVPTWRELKDKFEHMMQEEIRTTPHSRMAATLIRSLLGEPWRVEFDQFQIEWPLFLEKFKLVATEAGRLLGGRPGDATDLEHWMDRLYRFCQAEHQSYVALTFSSGGGSISSVCEASATFCTWLEREDLDFQTLGRDGVSGRELQKMVAAVVEAHYPDNKTKNFDSPPPTSAIRPEVDAFLKRCNEISQKRIFRRHIWQSVGHATARQFEYWQAGDRKATTEDIRNFGRILREGPAPFIATLKQKKLIPYE